MTVMFLFGNHVLSTRKEVPRLNVLSPSDLPEIDPLGCFKSKLILEGFVKYEWLDEALPYAIVQADICVKKDDQFVSQSIVKTGAWEKENVQNLMKAVSLYKDAVFVGKFFSFCPE